MSAADLVFGACLLLGGGLLLLTLIVDDIFGGLLSAIHLGFDVAGVSPTPMLLGFIAMFGVGGLFGLHSLGAGSGVATLLGVIAGSIGAGAQQDMVGSEGRVSVGIPANRFGTVLISFAGASHNMTATADTEIAAGRVVKVVAVAGTNLVVEATPVASNEGARSDG
jgi:hypothetical protein